MDGQIQRRFGDKEKERGLIELALANGNARQAVRALEADKENGFKVSKDALTAWMRNEPERYEALRASYLPQVRRLAAEQSMASAAQRRALAGKLSKRLEETYEQLEPKDLSTAVRNLDVGAGIHTQRGEELNDQAPQAQPLQTAAALMKAFHDEGLKVTAIDEGDEGIDAVVVEEEDLEHASAA